MDWIYKFLIILLGYLIGSIPFGLVIVRLRTGKDLRSVESGRTGGTNAMRAAGFWVGLATALLDFFKSTSAVWIARLAFPDAYWLHVFAGIAAIVGHNYSIFMPERSPEGRLRLRGGAGGAPTSGGAAGLWFPGIFIILPAGALILYLVGYASVATLSVGVLAAVVFAIRAVMGLSPWQYIFYGIFAEVLLVYALRPNIRRIMSGNERLVGFRAQRKRRKDAKAAATQEAPPASTPASSRPFSSETNRK